MSLMQNSGTVDRAFLWAWWTSSFVLYICTTN
jgi:hypothetical protein